MVFTVSEAIARGGTVHRGALNVIVDMLVTERYVQVQVLCEQPACEGPVVTSGRTDHCVFNTQLTRTSAQPIKAEQYYFRKVTIEVKLPSVLLWTENFDM